MIKCHNQNFRILFVTLIVFCIAATGCQPLKRKFTRRKKPGDKKENFVPVLDPIDYAPRIESAEKRYRYHYSLWQVWHKELIQSARWDESEKRQKYLLSQLFLQMEEMKRWVVEEKEIEISDVLSDLQKIQNIYSKPEQLWDYNAIKRRLERIGKKVRNSIRPEIMQEFYKSLN